MSNKWLTGAIIFLAVSIIFASFMLSTAIKTSSEVSLSQIQNEKNNDILSIPEAATYINVTEDKIVWLLQNSENVDGKGIPHYKVDNKVYFSKKKLADWIQHISENNMEF